MTIENSIDRIKHEGSKYIPQENLFANMKNVMDLVYDTQPYVYVKSVLDNISEVMPNHTAIFDDIEDEDEFILNQIANGGIRYRLI